MILLRLRRNGANEFESAVLRNTGIVDHEQGEFRLALELHVEKVHTAAAVASSPRKRGLVPFNRDACIDQPAECLQDDSPVGARRVAGRLGDLLQSIPKSHP